MSKDDDDHNLSDSEVNAALDSEFNKKLKRLVALEMLRFVSAEDTDSRKIAAGMITNLGEALGAAIACSVKPDGQSTSDAIDAMSHMIYKSVAFHRNMAATLAGASNPKKK